MNAASVEAKNTAAVATSDGCDNRPSGIVATNCARFCGVSSPMKSASIAVSPATGLMTLTRMLSGASSAAIDRDVTIAAPLLPLYHVRPGRGRTPAVELVNGKPGGGRDHNHWGFTVWLAGGGVKGGTVIGATDEFGYRAVEQPIHVHDLHATLLHLLGFDHERLTYRYAGRDFRLTDVHGKVVKEVVA